MPTKITKTDTNSDKVILLIPGISGGVGEGKYDRFAQVCIEHSFNFIAFQPWENLADLETKNINWVHTQISDLLNKIRSEYKQIYIVGKSFGGAMVLSVPNLQANKVVLWAPAIGVGETSNLAEKSDLQLSEIPSLLDVKLDQDYLSKISISIEIIHGDTDTAIPIGNSTQIVELLPQGELEIIPNMGHSAKTPEEETILTSKTLDFFLK